MKILPHDLLYSAAQPFVFQGAMQQSLTLGLGVDLATGRVLPAPQVFGAATAALAPGDCLDMGLPKRQAEWLLAGQAQTPGALPRESLLVEIAVGANSRRFLVKGEEGKGEFVSAPLVWRETFGAPDNPENPLGCGLEPDPATGKTRAPRLVGANDAYGRPACPGPMGAWPARMGKMGTYDKDWLKTRNPDLPDDCDYSFVNLAQAAQRLPQGLQGDETLTLKGLHRDAPEISARLPGKTLHVFVLRQGANQEEELRVPYDTLWLFPNQRLALLLGHILLPSIDGRGSDIQYARLEMRPPEPVAEAETPPPPPPFPPAEPPPPEGDLLSSEEAALSAAALAAGAAKMDGAGKAASAAQAATKVATPGAAAAATTAAGAGAGATAAGAAPLSPLQAEGLKALQESLGEINAGLAEAGVAPLTPAQIEATKQEIIRQAAAMENMQRELDATPPPDLHATLRQAGVSEQMIAGVDAVLEMSPPDPSRYSDAASWNAAIARYQADFERHLPLSDDTRKMQTTLMQLQGPGGQEKLAQMTGPTPTLESTLAQAGIAPDKAALLSRELQQDPKFNSLTELKTYMSGLEKQMDFPPGSMTSVVTNMEKAAADAGIMLEPPAAQVTDKVTDKATAPVTNKAAGAAPAAAAAPSPAPAAAASSQAQSSALQTASSTLSAASLAQEGAAQAAGVPPPAPSPVDAAAAPPPPPPAAEEPPPNLDFSYQDLAGQDFSGQKLDGAIFHDAKLAGANFSGASLQNTDFDRADCAGANFDRALLNNGSFAETMLSGASLQGASAESARFIGSDLQQAKAAGLNAKEAEFDGAKLVGASFAGANFAKAGIRRVTASQVNLAQADFSDAALYDSDFSGANFSGARLPRSVTNNVLLTDANFSKADLTQATLMGGSDLTRGNLSGAILQDADWREVVAKEAAFVESAAQGGRFVACDFSACRWQGARAGGADFSYAQLTGADFTGANLMEASLREATVAGASFAKANLYASDLYRVTTETADLSGAMTGNTLLAARKNA
ncbi:hypothetical protein FACS189475_00730 [Betaproteobacteria bacterium]|nr:hypothetical protein FACS189475_00730 [Betaproteobacteria bacterium]